jgi:hypothetical protein
MTQKLLLNACKAIFEDGRFYLSRISSLEYSMPLELFSGSTLGQHTRHWIEFFQCLLFLPTEKGVICYDKRKRDLDLEKNPLKALNTLAEMETALQEIYPPDVLILASELPDGTNVELTTSFRRELWFVVEHAVHHLALIKIGLKTQFPDWVIPEHFGVATSTLKNNVEQITTFK